PADLSPAAAREKEEVEAVWSNAARLRIAGVDVALTSGGGDADLLEGMRKVVEYGLAPDDALRALTVTPAELLGVPGITRVEAGRPATFVVTTGPLAQEDARIRYTFVEGHLTEVEVGGGGGSGDAPAGDLSGAWSGTITAGGQEMDLSLTLTQSDDGSLQGQATAAGQTPSSVTGAISGASVTLRIEAEDLPEPIVLDGTLSDDGDSLSGSGSTPF
ncbi:MAG: amidohydrolase family protein, partial [Gemmatimonadota bacterium]